MYHMKFVLTICTLVIASASTFAFAQETTQKPLQAIREARTENREDLKKGRAEIRTETKEKIETIKRTTATGTPERKAEVEKLREGRKDALEANREEFKKKQEELKEARKEAIETKVKGKAEQVKSNLIGRLNQTLSSLEKNTTRIEEAAQKAADRGTDVSSVTSALTEAKAKTAIARERITALGNLEAIPEDSKIGRERLTQVRQSVEEARKALVDAGQSVRKAAVALQQILKNSRQQKASSTEATIN